MPCAALCLPWYSFWAGRRIPRDLQNSAATAEAPGACHSLQPPAPGPPNLIPLQRWAQQGEDAAWGPPKQSSFSFIPSSTHMSLKARETQEISAKHNSLEPTQRPCHGGSAQSTRLRGVLSQQQPAGTPQLAPAPQPEPPGSATSSCGLGFTWLCCRALRCRQSCSPPRSSAHSTPRP